MNPKMYEQLLKNIQQCNNLTTLRNALIETLDNSRGEAEQLASDLIENHFPTLNK